MNNKCLVYHDKEPRFGIGSESRVWPDDFDLVAVVDVNDPDAAFGLTNHTDDAGWTRNRGVRVLMDGVRSTSVGDIVVTPDGKVYLCQNIGWAVIGDGLKKITLVSTMTKEWSY